MLADKWCIAKCCDYPISLDEETDDCEHDPSMTNTTDSSKINKLKQIKNKRSKANKSLEANLAEEKQPAK